MLDIYNKSTTIGSMTNKRTLKLIKTLTEAPDTQIAGEIRHRIQGLQWCDGPAARMHLRTIVDDCVKSDLASSFAVAAMVEMVRIDDLWA